MASNVVNGDNGSLTSSKKGKPPLPLSQKLDKIKFVLSLINLSITEFIALKYPESFWIWYSVLIPVLLVIRYEIYHAAKWGYFLLDFCYAVQAMCLAQIFLFPANVTLFQINFAFSNGPLIWALLVWRNGFVLHSLDKMTSVSIHLLPAFLTFCLRWYHDPSIKLPDVSFYDSVVVPMFVFGIWQVLYLIKTEVLDKEKLAKDMEISTSMRWFAKKPGIVGSVVLTGLRRVGLWSLTESFNPASTNTKVIYCATQFLYTFLTLLPIAVLYAHFWLHLALLVLMFLVCAWNGASYYIEVFGGGYED